MQIEILDANNQTQIVIWQSIETPTDKSGAIATTNTPQTVFADTTNGGATSGMRGGWFFQNNSQSGNAMLINETGNAAAVGIVINPGQSFPPPGYPVPQGAITVSGTAGDAFTARQW